MVFSTIFSPHRLLLILTLSFVAIAKGQVQAFTIYTEDFNDPADDGKGAIGVTSTPANNEPPSVDLDGVDWTVSNISNVFGLDQTQQNNDDLANLTAATDWFQVRNNRFEARDVDGVAIWTSREIDISSFSNVSFSLDFSEFGDLEETGGNGSLDFVDVEFIIDGTTTTIANQNGFAGNPSFEQHTLLGDFDSRTISQTGLSGNNLQLVVSIQNWAGVETTVFDNVLIEEVPWEFSPNLGLVILGVIFGGNHCRRKLQAK